MRKVGTAHDKIEYRSEFIRSIPRSSNGRTAAFGAVNRGSNPCRGANLQGISNLQEAKSPLYKAWYKIGCKMGLCRSQSSAVTRSIAVFTS